jgi:hypothetical protein
MSNIFITGDLCPINRVEQKFNNGDFGSVYNVFLPVLRNSYLNITNLVCPLYNGNGAIQKTGPNLKGALIASKLLKFIEISSLQQYLINGII